MKIGETHYIGALQAYCPCNMAMFVTHKAAFITPRGLFEPTVMYFGLCNSPSTFMRMMQTIFRECLRRRLCVIYMDDIICMGKTKEELKHNTIEVLKILEEHDLYIKDTKC